MKIVYFVNAAWYFELHWLDRSEAATRKGYEVHLVSNFADGDIKKNLEKKGIKCWNIELNRFSKNVFNNILILTTFRKICKKIKPDLIHLITIKPVIFGGLYARVARIPFIVSFVGLGRLFGNKRGWLNTFIFRSVLSLYRILLSEKSPAQVIFEHNADFSELSKYIKFDKNNVHIIEGAGIDNHRFNYQPELIKNDFSILFASRLLWSKGLGEVVEAVDNIKKNKNNTILYVAGIIDDKDPDRIELDQILQWEKQEKIIWLGRRNDMHDLIRNSNVVILPTKYSEGVPRIIIEACAMGRSCIVGNVPGCKAIIKDNFNGCVLQTHSPDEITQKIEYLRDNIDVRRKFGIRSAEIVKERFVKEIVIDKTLIVYNKALSTTKR